MKLVFNELESKGFLPDVVTYNSLLYAFARDRNVEKVKEICEEMVKMGFGKDEMTYNTMIHMYGKQGKHDFAFKLYRDMKLSGRNPDAITYTVLIDSLGKANKITEAANVMSEMLDAGVKPTLRTYSALICGYAKAGKQVEAQETFECMVKSGIKPDLLAYSVMLDILFRFNETKKAMALYREMVRDGFLPDNGLYQVMLRVLGRENKLDAIEKAIRDMELLCGTNPQVISSVLVKGECYDHAAKILRLAISNGYELDRENLLTILCSYSSSGRHSEACELLEFLKEHAPGSHQLVNEALVVTLEYGNAMGFDSFSRSSTMYESLIQGCEENELLSDASQVFSDMRFVGVTPSEHLYQSMALLYCKMGFPETAHHLIEQAESKGIQFDSVSIYVSVVDAYGKLKLWQKAESLVGILRGKRPKMDRKIWNAFIHAYVESGCYERARAVFNSMMRDGPSPTVESINGLLQALIADERLEELYVVIQELQDMGFKISKSSILLMLDAFARASNMFEVKKIYQGMKAAVRDVEAMISEMEEAGFKLYSSIDDFRKTTRLDTYKSLISAFGKQQLLDQAEELFEELRSNGRKLDRSFYHTMIKLFRNSGNSSKAESLLGMMKEAGIDPNIATMHMLMMSYSGSGQPQEAENVLNNLKTTGLNLSTLPYSSVIDAYLKNEDYNIGIQKLNEMQNEDLEPDHRIWTCFVRAASLSQRTSEAIILLKALSDTGFDLPIRILTEKTESLISEVDQCLEKLGPLEDDTAFNFVNALEDLLWAFELRATASWVFQLAIKRGVYRHDVFRVADKDWGADFRKLSAGSALFALILWLDHMQYNNFSLNSTLKACLWEMGSPFLSCRTRSGLLIAKAHSLRMWLKDSPFCLDLELKDAPSLPESNSMQLIEGCFLRRGLVPAFKEITERLGVIGPKKFSRLATLSDERRDKKKMKKKGGLVKMGKANKLAKRKYVRRSVLPYASEVKLGRKALT
ncbi:hypothetical protein UlMin_032532 [Ulmus minor]